MKFWELVAMWGWTLAVCIFTGACGGGSATEAGPDGPVGGGGTGGF